MFRISFGLQILLLLSHYLLLQHAAGPLGPLFETSLSLAQIITVLLPLDTVCDETSHRYLSMGQHRWTAVGLVIHLRVHGLLFEKWLLCPIH
ncbi:uncharacterized protein LAESUDRAFT_572850 [Laetiporus sulphureus 93-53]|uniref:Secreted protein n=1 Tax=Laetiporus sulphureus 93-53 TaxID=1314785 RepID=A0A165FJS5_9APHY|nr:uncharacterized protein LAESUDRAFT_572850 [Laetiporus sulphureus 93-53]KZT09078.1 hypothetical protein LAESUDRAFT_572850 [Laetiporus sulphureus 93-53]